MDVTDQERRKLKVFIAGGANMTMPVGTAPKRLVGTVNADFTRKALKEAGLRLQKDDTGGHRGRRVVIDCTTGDYTINTIRRLGDT
jgi:chemotaxis protein CheD